MAVITKTELEEAAVDAQTLEDVANAASSINGNGIITSRLGNNIKVLSKVIEDLGTVNDRGAWATATSYAVKDLVLESGVVYICIIAHTSGTFATDYTTNGYWAVYQSQAANLQPILAEGAFVDGDKTKLDGIEAGADVTDATNVNAAGAVMNSDTSTAGMSFVIDEDNMASNSATKVPTQQSVKAYVDGSIPATANFLSSSAMLHVREEQTSGTESGTFTQGAWRTRVFNTVKRNTISGASLSSNQITLPAGNYIIVANAPAFSCQYHKAKLYNVTDTADEIIGTSENTNDSGFYATHPSRVEGYFSIASSKTFELQHWCTLTQVTYGFGKATSIDTEIYAEAIIYKVG